MKCIYIPADPADPAAFKDFHRDNFLSYIILPETCFWASVAKLAGSAGSGGSALFLGVWCWIGAGSVLDRLDRKVHNIREYTMSLNGDTCVLGEYKYDDHNDPSGFYSSAAP